MNIVIVGGVAAGPKTASRITRLNPDAKVVMFERGAYLSFAGCGLPYYVGGQVKDMGELLATPVGVTRDEAFFQKVKNVEVRTRVEVTAIDRAARTVAWKNLETGETGDEPYDKLVLATGASPIRPPLPGADLKSIFPLHTVDNARDVKATAEAAESKHCVIVGGGLIGVEMAEALVEMGCEVTLVEMLPQILKMLDWEMALQVQRHMEAKGVRVLTDTRVEAFVAGADGTTLGAVRTTQGELPAELAILSVGVRPNVELARAADIEVGALGGIVTDDGMRTSDPDIYAAGDCVESLQQQTGKPVFTPLGSTANKQGRVVADNICGGDERFPGVLGSCVCKAFDFTVARTGLTEAEARAADHDVVVAMGPGPDRSHYYPGFQSVLMKMIADRSTRKLLGLQCVGPGQGDKRVDVAATAIAAGLTVDAVANLDLVYAPPYSSAMDNIITTANIVRNKIDGLAEGLSAAEVKARRDRGDDFVLLDVRTPAEVAEVALPGAVNIPLGAVRGRLDEIPRDKEVVCFCKVSLRGYEAARILKNAGHKNAKFLDGGVVMWPYEKTTA